MEKFMEEELKLIVGKIKNSKNITEDEYLKMHRFMWETISRKTLELERVYDKIDFIEEFIPEIGLEMFVFFDCFCCMSVNRNRAIYNSKDLSECENCKNCPLDWSNKICAYSEYKDWINCFRANDWEYASEVAKKIAELPRKNNNRK